MPYTEAHKRATMKYQKENYIQLNIRLAPETRKEIDDHVVYTGETMTKFVKRAIAETIERDRQAIAQKNKAERKARQE